MAGVVNALLRKDILIKDKAELLKQTKVYVNARDKYDKTALILASSEGYTEVVKSLLDKGADVNANDHNGFTALMWAAYRGPQR